MMLLLTVSSNLLSPPRCSAQSVFAGFTEGSHRILDRGRWGHGHVAYEIHNFIDGGTMYGNIL